MSRTGRAGDAAWLDLALAGPAVLWLAAAMLVVVAALLGYRVLAAPADLTLSEAAALRDHAEVVRLIRSGADPDEPGRVRSGIIREQEYMMTPLEAATVTRGDDVARLLVSEGATLSGSNFPVLYCLAAGSEFDDMVDVLQELAPGEAAPSCEGGALPL